jgi:hypothetical protein
MSNERRLPVLRADFSVLDTEFNSIRERFDQEMQKMEEEMTKFRSELLSRESSFMQNAMSSVSSSSSSTTHKSEFKTWIDGEGKSVSKPSENGTTNVSSSVSSSSSSIAQQMLGGFGDSPIRSWLEGLNSPLIQQGAGGDGKQLKLRFDVSQYVPEEIVVKTVDNKLLVHAKHEEKTDSSSVYREYNREFLLPNGTNPEAIKSSLSKDGILTVEAPLQALGGGGASPMITSGH